MILPGARLGVLGGGQLGQMFAMAARRMGYQVVVLDPDPESPAAAFANQHIQADYQDQAALDLLATCAAVTTEFENVPAASLRYLAERTQVAPPAAAVEIAQHRLREKTYFQDAGVATVRFAAVNSLADCASAWERIAAPAILKTATLGYDGKGQQAVHDLASLQAAFQQLQGVPCVLEEKVDLLKELSVIVARNQRGEAVTYPVGENVHSKGILHTTLVPAAIAPELADAARQAALAIAAEINYCGVLAVEFFVTRDGRLLANEMAPRPHNSGHYSMDACVSSQFEQQVRTLCDLPLGDTRLLSPVAMLNLLGDLWREQQAPAWQAALQASSHLHLYGKQQPRAGRKMGHVNCLAATPAAALALAEHVFQQLQA